MSFEDDFARRHPGDVEKRGGSTYVAVELAGEFIDAAEPEGIGILGMDGFLVGEFTYPALGRIADFSVAGDYSDPAFVARSCKWARSLLAGPWRTPPTGEADQIHSEAKGRYMIDFMLTKKL